MTNIIEMTLLALKAIMKMAMELGLAMLILFVFSVIVSIIMTQIFHYPPYRLWKKLKLWLEPDEDDEVSGVINLADYKAHRKGSDKDGRRKVN